MSNEVTEEAEAEITKGDIEGLVRRVQATVEDFYKMMEPDRLSEKYGGPTLRDFTRSIHRLQDAAERFEHGKPQPRRIPYKNEIKASHGNSTEIEETHESFGLVTFSRISGSRRLFGSHLDRHQHYIQMSVKRGKRIHGLSSDHYHSQGPDIVELAMSASQFAELVTSLNYGSGVPCTLQRIDGISMEEVPEETQTEHQLIRDEFEKDIEETTVSLEAARDELQKLVDSKGAISKTAAKKVLGKVYKAAQQLRSNAPFVVDSFRKSTEKVVSSAKAEIDSFVLDVVQTAGLEALASGHLPSLRAGETKALPEDAE